MQRLSGSLVSQLNSGLGFVFTGGAPGRRYCLPGHATSTYMYTSYFATTFDNYFMLALPGPRPGLDSYLNNQGKTAYVYPAYELSLFLQALA